MWNGLFCEFYFYEKVEKHNHEMIQTVSSDLARKCSKLNMYFYDDKKLLNPSRENYCLVAIYFSDIPVNFQIKSIFKLATMFTYWWNHICSLYSGGDVNNKHIFLAINFSRSVGHFVDCLLSTHWNLLLLLYWTIRVLTQVCIVWNNSQTCCICCADN